MNTAMHWRNITTLDLHAVEAIAAAVHPGFPEDMAVFVERQRRYPEGARLLELGGVPSGYVLAHPWRHGELPALNSLLGPMPADADTFYLHDLALLPPARGTGAAAHGVDLMLRHARLAGFATASLVAVNGSAPFWSRQGFDVVAATHLAAKLASYEPKAQLMVKAL